MISIHSLLITPATSPADEKPSPDPQLRQASVSSSIYGGQPPTPPWDEHRGHQQQQANGHQQSDSFFEGSAGVIRGIAQAAGLSCPIPQTRQEPCVRQQSQQCPSDGYFPPHPTAHSIEPGSTGPQQNPPKVPIRRLSSRKDSCHSNHRTSPYPTSPPKPNGPISKDIKLPPRPQPGRKPIIASPEDGDSALARRKAQNRKSQRDHRKRKTDRVDELEAEVEVQRQSLRQALGQHQSFVFQHDREVAELEKRYEEVRAYARQLRDTNEQLQLKLVQSEAAEALSMLSSGVSSGERSRTNSQSSSCCGQ